MRDISTVNKEKISRPTNAVLDACRCAPRTVNAAGCWTVPLTTGKFLLVFFICGSPQKKNLQGRRFSFDRVGRGQGHGVAMIPAAGLGIHYEGRSVFWCACGMLTSTNTSTYCSRLYSFAQNIPSTPTGFAGKPKIDT